MPGYDPAAASHRALRGIRRALERHPAVTRARGFPTGEFPQVVATLDSAVLGIEADDSSLTVRWFAGELPGERPEFSMHYSDATGVDFGWHHEPNPHVEGWGHFQHRRGSSAEYSYRSHTFSSTEPTRVIWEVMERLETRLGRR